MGGLGSTRWLWHTRKTQVEECLRLHIKTIKENLKPGYMGSVFWSRGERVTHTINYRVLGEEIPVAVRLNYIQTNRSSGEKNDFDYGIILTPTPLAWGGVRYWFVCPLVVNNLPCRRRVGCLYLPPKGQYFGCRDCYDLTYRSSQESGQFKGFYESLAASMQSDYPGITGRDVRYMLEDKFTPHMEEMALKKYISEWEPPPDRYADYLTAEALCREAGISSKDLQKLMDIRLIVPDTPNGRYRPKLLGWAKKLAYLIDEGWELIEIKRWASGRFDSENPKQWPPDMERWQF